LTSRSFAVIGKMNSGLSEPDKIESARTDLRNGIEEFVSEDKIRYVIDIRGKRESGIDVCASPDRTCTASTFELVRSMLAKDFLVTLRADEGGVASGSAIFDFSRKSDDGRFLVESVRLEIGPEERQFQKEKVISDISEIAEILNSRS